MKQIILVVFVLFCFVSCASEENAIKVEVNDAITFQTIQGFGASDCWRVKYVGQNWPVEKRNKIADLLFSLENDSEGNPLGIGLSSWRFYLGSGSAEQGDASNIRNEWRRSECFLDATGRYDWTKCTGQRWFLQAAKQRGVHEFQIFTISPPVFYTRNGQAYSIEKDLSFNLQEDKYDDYASFLADVIAHFKNNEGIHFNYLSPFNEPQWDWGKGSQEGTPASNEELYLYLKHVSDSLHARALETKIIAGEAGDIKYLYQSVENSNSSDQINVFFNPESPLFIGDFKNMEYAITGHSYFSTWPLENQINQRIKVNERIHEINPELDYWQTEFCILEKNDETTGGWGRDLGMNTALYVARVIHSDLSIANARAWEWWTALSQFNFKDGLIHLDDGNGNSVESDTSRLNKQLMFDGNITETKLLWAMGNFSRFVRPGMVRINATFENDLSLLDQATGLQVSAYKDFDSGKTVLVFINHKSNAEQVKLNGLKATTGELYVTDETRSLDKIDVKLSELSVPGRSVSTLVIND